MNNHLKNVLSCVSVAPIQLLGNFRNSQNTLLRHYVRVCANPTDKQIKSFEKCQYNDIIDIDGIDSISSVKIKMHLGKIILTGLIVESETKY